MACPECNRDYHPHAEGCGKTRWRLPFLDGFEDSFAAGVAALRAEFDERILPLRRLGDPVYVPNPGPNIAAIVACFQALDARLRLLEDRCPR